MVTQTAKSVDRGSAGMSSLPWRLVPIVVALAGVWLLVQSASMGLSAAEAMVPVGGGMQTEQFLHLVDAQTAAYRLLGAVLLGVGTARALLYVR
jgi:hypothetical protein